jgi:pimeloyl-ACP methyl ester carboxylesterase
MAAAATSAPASGPSFLALGSRGAVPAHGLTVVLLPGLGGNALTFPTQLMDAVGAATDAALVLSVTYGFPFGPTMEDTADSVWAALRGLPLVAPLLPLPSRVLLLGYSMGGFVAQAMAARAPAWVALQGLVLVASAVPSAARLPAPASELWRSLTVKPPLTVMQRLQGLFPHKWLKGATEPTLRALAATLDAAHVTKAVRTQQLVVLMRFLFSDGVARLVDAHAHAPLRILALHGAQDRVLDAGTLQRTLDQVVAAVSGTDQGRPATVDFKLFPDAGHGLPYQEGAALVAALHAWWAAAGVVDAGTGLAADTPDATLLPGLFWL